MPVTESTLRFRQKNAEGNMRLRERDTIALAIDGPNLFATARALGFDIDYKRLLGEFESRGTLVRALYYSPIVDEDSSFSSVRPLLDWLDFNGYSVVTKPTKVFVDETGRRKLKGRMNVELVVGAMVLARYVEQLVLFSGDGDFCPLVAALKRRGVLVTVVSTISTRPAMLADGLRRQADRFIDLADLQRSISRDVSEGSARQIRRG